MAAFGKQPGLYCRVALQADVSVAEGFFFPSQYFSTIFVQWYFATLLLFAMENVHRRTNRKKWVVK
jgi:hypothetical protein|tara:strand:- start:829 stop:1026 length:198 start_codon:yes stop_codon:yes gene_type:complete